ncbi:unnamed protein product [Periconia digitata]|uniref:Intramembrane protease 2 n=1 Tax=Periconia digitata TaxID=1303443 RepID=A0A9W4XE85_9PLEO|nr:unnamed protein product [Periconia digitata]
MATMDDAADPWARMADVYSEVRPYIPTYTHLLLSALFPIYAGAHASLTRPSSAAKPTKKERRARRRKQRSESDDASSSETDSDSEDEDEDQDDEHRMEGLAPTDAIMMPLFAGLTLAGLYFLIKWLEDPVLLNKFLNWYFALFGVFSVSRLITDTLDVGHSLIFPHRYALAGTLYHVHQKEKRSLPVSGVTKGKGSISSPLPGVLARIPLTQGLRKLLWNDRAMPGKKWTLRLYIHHMFSGKILIGPHGMVGGLVAILAVGYFNFVDKPWYLTNLMGFGFSYGALQLMSPTTFGTGSLILGALFFYDIYFVFFTPMMVTVAKSLDVPIKLVFPRPPPADDPTAKAGHAMLGLGDVVLPGIMIGLALRFDLFLFYLRRQKRRDSVTAAEDTIIEKPRYFSLSGRWSDHFWTHSLITGRPLFQPSPSPSSSVENKELAKTEAPFTFPKTYFKAGLVGYVAGMLCTLGVMHVWGHAQPALLYLVPGVLSSLWLTALAKGELAMMWDFSEALEEEEEEQKLESGEPSKDGNEPSKSGKAKTQRSSFFSLSDEKARAREDQALKVLGRHVLADSDDEDDISKRGSTSCRRRSGASSRKEVLSLSILAPWAVKSSLKNAEKEADEQKDKDKPNWAPSSSETEAAVLVSNGKENELEPPSGKRVRLRK